MTLFHPCALGSPVPSRPGLGLTLIVASEGFTSAAAFDQATLDWWERLIDIAPLDSLETPAGNCCVYTSFDDAVHRRFGVDTGVGGVLQADPDAVYAFLAQSTLSEPTGSDPLAALADLPWPDQGATAYATSLFVVLVDTTVAEGCGEWLGVDRLDVPYHVVVSSGPLDGPFTAKALGRMAGLAGEEEDPAATPAFARRRGGLNLLSSDYATRIETGDVWDPWQAWRWSPAFATDDVIRSDGAWTQPADPTVMRIGAGPGGPDDDEHAASGFGRIARWSLETWA